MLTGTRPIADSGTILVLTKEESSKLQSIKARVSTSLFSIQNPFYDWKLVK